jgi:hypothetical protein
VAGAQQNFELRRYRTAETSNQTALAASIIIVLHMGNQPAWRENPSGVGIQFE